jgi:hypothetical protein
MGKAVAVIDRELGKNARGYIGKNSETLLKNCVRAVNAVPILTAKAL